MPIRRDFVFAALEPARAIAILGLLADADGQILERKHGYVKVSDTLVRTVIQEVRLWKLPAIRKFANLPRSNDTVHDQPQ